MTFSSPRRWLVLALLAAPVAWAGLGEPQSSVDRDGVRMHAQHAVARSAQYAVHELTKADGSQVHQFVASNGRVFAVSWHTMGKPDLSNMLGVSFPGFSSAANDAAKRGGMQRQFRHDGVDLVVQSTGRLNVYRGFAYRPSMMPKGLSPSSIGMG